LLGDGRARHLHQREHALLHPSTARRGKHNKSRFASGCRFKSADDRFTCRHAKGTAHEVEVLNPDGNCLPLHGTDADLDRVDEAGFCFGVPQTINIALFIAEFQRIQRDFRKRDILEGAAVEH
jgi:hypothetical protein